MSYQSGGGYGGDGRPIHAFYGVIIHDCIKRGDKEEMRKIAAEARAALQKKEGASQEKVKEVEDALKELEAALNKAG
ncbi:MAG: DUF1843 domain-containing protein [Candidatus Eremiobacteraeota bacterium]|nr:DUF1843 domain-containing protein [Candidatus Eremiobacteraeota bacterium]